MNNKEKPHIYGTSKVFLFVNILQIESYPIITDSTKENWYLAGLWINQKEKPPNHFSFFGAFDTPQLAEKFYQEYKRLHGASE